MEVTSRDWTCARCGVIASFMAIGEAPVLPVNWSEASGVTYCLSCQREMAGEVAAAALSAGDTIEEQRLASTQGQIEFEMRRNPDQGDTRIARACHAPLVTVRRIRERLGTYPTGPS
jgi:hypothetical protein